jgi:hypothetical protein
MLIVAHLIYMYSMLLEMLDAFIFRSEVKLYKCMCRATPPPPTPHAGGYSLQYVGLSSRRTLALAWT